MGCPTTSWPPTGARIEAVTVDDVLAAARKHIRLEDASAVLVGDAATVADGLRELGFAELEVIRDEAAAPAAEPRRSASPGSETFRPRWSRWR